MVGLDREAAKRAFDGFLTGKTFTATQIHFVNVMIDYLTQSGWMRPSQLYESPFTHFSPRGIEGVFNAVQVTQLLSILDGIRQTAAI
jgi:type I restriction enzyme, R subunit